MLHHIAFIWVFTVRQSIHLWVSGSIGLKPRETLPTKFNSYDINVQNALPMVCIISVDMPFDMLLKRKSKYTSLTLSRMKYHHI